MKIRVLGVMTGTSCDGLDAACLEFRSDSWKPVGSFSMPYPPELRKRVLEMQAPGFSCSPFEIMKLDRDLGDWYGKAILKGLKKTSIKVDLIANHGQTIAHFPQNNNKGMTLQLGDSARIAVHTGKSVVSRFRDGDLAAGGKGAPLVPLFHRILIQKICASRKTSPIGIAIHNIGGISNLTYLGQQNHMIAFDTGPGNIWIDAATKAASQGKLAFDPQGKIAGQNVADLNQVKNLLKHPYFKKGIPKSTGRNEFPFEYFVKKVKKPDSNAVATATHLTVRSIFIAYYHWIINKDLPLKEIWICGGGAKNKTLCNQLQNQFRPFGIRVTSLEHFSWNPQLIEAQAFSLYGFLALLGQPLGGEWTGAEEFGPPGHLTPGKNWMELMKKATFHLKDFSKIRRNLSLS
jgi:anhydro-N-acetylmuramic acid kinase